MTQPQPLSPELQKIADQLHRHLPAQERKEK